MFKLATFLSLAILASAKTIYLENDLEDVTTERHESSGIWILDFDNDFEVNSLRQPNKAELRIFKNSIAPVIKRNQRIINENEKLTNMKVKPDKNGATIKEIKLELKKIINIFLHSIAVVNPTQSIFSKKDHKTSLKIYFSGNSCALVLQSGRFRNVYYNQAEQGLLPRWFFEKHDNIENNTEGDFIAIPKEVKTEFYEDLKHLVITLYGYAI